MKTIIKLLIAVVIANAAIRSGLVALDYYQLQDAAQQTLLFAGNANVNQLRDEILRKAVELEVPLTQDALNVRRDGTLTVAEAKYTEEVELFPRYRYPLTLSFTVDARNYDTSLVNGAKP